MLKTLSQIVATFFTVVITFIAVFLIYLYSAQSDIDAQIQIKGSEIANLLRSAPTYNLNTLFSDDYLIKTYQDKYPNLPLLGIYSKIVEDITNALFISNIESMQMLSSFHLQNPEESKYAWLWISQIRRYMDYLAPRGVWWPGRDQLISYAGPTPYNKQNELFPFGTLGVEEWSSDFITIKNNLNSLNLFRGVFLNDLQNYKNSLNKKNRKIIFNYQGWVEQIQHTFLKIDAKNNHIQSLLNLKKKYLFKNRIPHINLITTFSVIAIIVGLIIPMIIFSYDKESILNPKINISILILTFLSILISATFLVKDIAYSQKEGNYYKYIDAKYLTPINEQLTGESNERAFFVYDLINSLLSQDKSLILSENDKTIFNKYRTAIIDSNKCTNEMIKTLEKELLQSKILSAHSFEPKSKYIGIEFIHRLIPKERRNSFFEKFSDPHYRPALEATYGGGSTIILTINIPFESDKKSNIKEEINKIYEKYLKSSEGIDCMKKRKLIDYQREKILNLINKITLSHN